MVIKYQCLLMLFVSALISCGRIGDPPFLFHFQNCWTAAGSTGIVDDAARDNIILGFPPDPNVIAPPDGIVPPQTIVLDQAATLDNRSPMGLYQIRYPLHQQFIYRLISGEDNFTYSIFLEARYRVIDQERSGVIVQLKRARRDAPTDTGREEQVEILMSLNSDDFNQPSQVAFQTEEVFRNEVLIDFSQFIYYVDVQLIQKQSNDGVITIREQSLSPAIATIALCLGGGGPVE